MYKKALILAGLVFSLTACSSDNEESQKPQTEEEKIYANNCASCHGNALEGSAGPNLEDIGSKMSKEEILEIINNGGNGMPPELIQGEEADKVAAWLDEKK
jgi:cytochrome c551